MKTRPSARLQRLRWGALALCVLAGIINYMDRSTLAIAGVQIRGDLGLNATAIGALLSAWSLTYALSQLPMGLMVDRLGPRWLLGLGLILWSVAQAAGGFITGFGQLLWSRIALGVGESPQFLTAARVVGNWFNIRERGVPSGMYEMAGNLGTALAPPILTLIMLVSGWRVMFIAMGAFGIVVAMIWMVLYRDPNLIGLTEREREHIAYGRVAPTPHVSLREWGRLFRFSTIWGMIIGGFCGNYANWMYRFWLPGYLEMQRHMSVGRTGFLASIPMFAAVVGALCGGGIADWLGRRGLAPMNTAKYPIVVGFAASAICSCLGAFATSSTMALTFMSLAMFLQMIAGAGSWLLPSVIAPQNYVASSASIQNFGGYLGASASPLLTGVIVDMTGSFTMALLIGAGMSAAGCIVYLFVVRRPIEASALSETSNVPATYHAMERSSRL